MKKTLLIIAVVLCVAVAGAALALNNVNNATNVTGTLTADSYLALSLGGTADTAISISYDNPGTYTIECNVTKSASVTDTGTLTITLADTIDNKTLDNVTVTLYDSDTHTTPIANATQTGEGTIVISGISTTTTYYAVISLAGNLDEAATNAVGGTMTLSFAKA